MSPRVTVLMPAYQASATVGAAISSVLSQTYRDLELIVVDDGSTDATGAIAAAYPAPVRMVRREQNGGCAAARNTAFEHGTGELIALCDADDFLMPRHIEALVGVHDQHRGIVAGNLWWMFPGGIHRSKVRYKGKFPAPDEQRMAILQENFVAVTAMYPRRIVDEVGPMDDSLRRAEDWEFWIRAIFAGHRVNLQPIPLALYRWGSTSLSADVAEMDRAVHDVLTRVARRQDLTPAEREYVERRLTSVGVHKLARDGDRALLDRRYRDAARLYTQAADLDRVERRLVWKSRVMRLAPGLVGPLVRARQVRADDRVGMDETLRR